ncbi:MAG: hypothetical protein U1E42_09435 [Rhodospirillales bacterium]
MKIANDNPSDDLTEHTRKVWQPRLGRELSLDETKQIAANVTGFFSILAEWSRDDLPSPVNDNASVAAAAEEGVGHDR